MRWAGWTADQVKLHFFLRLLQGQKARLGRAARQVLGGVRLSQERAGKARRAGALLETAFPSTMDFGSCMRLHGDPVWFCGGHFQRTSLKNVLGPSELIFPLN